MNAMNVSTRQLRAFVALCEQRNFTRAAAASHLSQPAFSALIRQLEDTLGARLFDRSTRHVELNAEGREFEAAARRVLAEFDAALGGVRDRAERKRGRVSVALLPSLAAGWLPQVLADFRAAYPGIELEVADVLSEPCIERVRSGQADFALAASGAGGTADSDLRASRLCTDRFHLVCRADHPLAHEPRLTLKKIAPHPFIQMTRNSSVRQALDAALHPQRLNSVFEVEHLATVMGLIEAGLGISVVPALTLFHFQRETLVTRPLPLPSLTRTLYLVQRREGSLSVAAQTLHDLIVERLGSLRLD